MAEFNHKISVVPPDANGQPDTANPLRVWASVEDLSGRKLQQAQFQEPETTHLFKVWFSAAITDDCFIVFEDATYVIDYILDKGKPFRNMFMELYAHRARKG